MTDSRKRNILIVDDSALMRMVISDIMGADDRLVVADIAINGLDAYEFVRTNPKKYDAIILDLTMPKMSGIEFLERLNKEGVKQKVIVVSSLAKEGAKETIKCLELGAFDFVTKPDSFIMAKEDTFKSRLLSVIYVATGLGDAERPTTGKPTGGMRVPSYAPKEVKHAHKAVSSTGRKVIALACSTGGPKALQDVIPYLPENLNAPVLLVQHMPVGFTNSLAQRLNELSKVNVKEAEEGDILKKGCVYIAKGGTHLQVVKKFGNYQIAYANEPARGGLKPCADVMYESLACTDYDDVICVVLTGMGMDGTNGIRQLNDTKNIYVIAQDQRTSIVYGMPKAIYDVGLVNEVVPLENVANAIVKITGVQ